MDNSDTNNYFALNQENMYESFEIFIDKECTVTKVISEADIEAFIQLSGDNNPIHHDEEFSNKTMFKGRVAHGLLAVGLISSALTRLMGSGNVWLSQNIEYLKPIRINDTVSAKAKIVEIKKNKVCVIETTCTNQKNELIITGTAQSRIFPIKTKK